MTETSAGADALGLSVENPASGNYFVEALFTTHNDYRQPDANDVYSPPAWAVEKYGPLPGGQQHLFVLVLGVGGNREDAEVVYTSPSLEFKMRTSEKPDRWANFPVWGPGWSYGLGQGEPRIIGGGSGVGNHISEYAVFRRRDGKPDEPPTNAKRIVRTLTETTIYADDTAPTVEVIFVDVIK